MIFDWDERKNTSNRRKHGVGFELAIQVFRDPLFLMKPDRVVQGELRWRTIGQIGGRVLLLVAHTVEDENEQEEVIRMISAREATPHERKEYEEGL